MIGAITKAIGAGLGRGMQAVHAALHGVRARSENYLLWPFSGPQKNSVHITEETALTLSAFWCAAKLISEGVARLPLNLNQKVDGKGAVPARSQQIYWLIKHRPNPMMTSFQWRETKQLHLISHGNAYSRIEYDGLGDVKALWPLHPSTVRPEVVGDELIYHVHYRGTQRTFQQREILHIRGLSTDGILGLGVIEAGARAMGVSIKAELYGDNFLSKNAQPNFILKHPGRLGKEGRANVREGWNESHQGPFNAGNVGILEEGIEPHVLSLPPEQVQWIQTRKLGVLEICRFTNVAPSMLHDHEFGTDRSTFEQTTLNHKVITLDPWLIRWEQQLDMALLPFEAVKQGYGFKHVTQAFERADFASRMDGYWKGRQAGLYSIDDMLELEDRNPLPNGAGRTYLVPGNHLVLDPEKPEGEQLITPPKPESSTSTPPENVIPITRGKKEEEADAAKAA